MSAAFEGGILVAGNIVYDTLVRPVDELRWNQSTWVESIDAQLGGNGAITSWSIGKLGIPVRLLAAIGQDSFAEFVLARLHEAGVDTAGVAQLESPTPVTIAVVHPNGARALLHRPGASREAFLERPVLTPESMAGCRHFHLANIYAVPALRSAGAGMLRRAKEAGLSTSTDTGWDSKGQWLEALAPCLPHTDILLANEEEARLLSGLAEPERAAEFFHARGVATVVVKLGGAGCLLSTGGSCRSIPGFCVDVVDTTGAGDSFAGGFLAAWCRGMEPAGAARFANAVGALSVSALGGTAGLKTWDETLAWIIEGDGPTFFSEGSK